MRTEITTQPWGDRLDSARVFFDNVRLIPQSNQRGAEALTTPEVGEAGTLHAGCGDALLSSLPVSSSDKKRVPRRLKEVLAGTRKS